MDRVDHRKIADLFAKEVYGFGSGSIVSVVLFGSVSTQTHTKESDIDLLILTKNENQNLMNVIQNASKKYSQNIKLSLNVVDYADYMEHLVIGDPFTVLIAKKGLCLLDSAAFNAAKILVDSFTAILNRDTLKNYLERTIHNKVDDILNIGIPKLKEDVRYTITYLLLLKKLSQHTDSKIKCDELLDMFSHQDDYVSEFYELYPKLFTLPEKSQKIESFSLQEIKEMIEVVQNE